MIQLLQRVNEESKILHTLKRRKAEGLVISWVGTAFKKHYWRKVRGQDRKWQ